MDEVDDKGMSAQESKGRYPLFEHEFREFLSDGDHSEEGSRNEQEQPRYYREIVRAGKALVRKAEHEEVFCRIPAVRHIDGEDEGQAYGVVLDNVKGKDEQQDVEYYPCDRRNKLEVFIGKPVEDHGCRKKMQYAELYHVLAAQNKIGHKGYCERNESKLDSAFEIGMAEVAGQAGDQNEQPCKIRFGGIEEIHKGNTPFQSEHISYCKKCVKEYHTEHRKAS